MLTNDIFQIILSYLSINQVYYIKKNINLITTLKFTQTGLLLGKLDVDIQLYCKYTKIENLFSMNRASKYGYLEVIKYFHSIGRKCTDEAMDYASYNGHIDVLRYLHSIGANCTVDAMNYASNTGYLNVVKYLHSIGAKCTVNAMNWASMKGHIDVVMYLHSIGANCTVDAINYARRNGHIEIVRCLHSIIIPAFLNLEKLNLRTA